MNLTRNGKAVLVGITGLLIVIAIGSMLIQSTGSEEAEPITPQTVSEKQGLTGTVVLGGLFPITGSLSMIGEDSKIVARLAVEDFNRHLAEKDSKWSLKLIVENTETSPTVALEKLMNLHAKDINLIVGPITSAEIHNIKGYSDFNSILLFSPSSSATELAIAKDNIFRLAADNWQLAPVIAGIMHDEGIKVTVPLWRGDVWGDSLKAVTEESLVMQGDIMSDGIRYGPESVEFSVSMSLLADNVQREVEKHGADKVAVLMLGFAEILQIMQSASQYEILDDVRWFGSNAVARDSQLIDDPISLVFSQKTQFMTPQITYQTNEIRQHIDKYVKAEFGRTPNQYAYASYDIVWLIGLAISQTESTDMSAIKEAIPEIARSYQGAIGSTQLNDAGDLAAADFVMWQIKDGQWDLIGKHQEN